MAPSGPSESQILYSYLLHPSLLPTIIPYKTFLALLPKSSAHLANSQHTDLSRLYRNLQFQRAITIDDIRRRIDSECLRSSTLTACLKRQIAREEMSARPKKRKYHHEDEDEDEEEDEETLIKEEVALKFDTALHDNIPLSNATPHQTPRQNHSSQSLLVALDTARRDLSSEITDLESSIAKLAAECEDTVGGLSDLRYGNFTRGRASGTSVRGSGSNLSETEGGLEDEVLQALQDLTRRLEAGSQME